MHIPFCASKCAYCAFFSQQRTEHVRQKYVDALIKQITKVKPTEAETIYIGGGTPSVLEPQQLAQILKVLPMYTAKETTVEVNPEHVTPQLAQTLLENGVNRISMGVQSFQENELRALGRRADAQDCIEAVKILRRAGFQNISIDLMLAIPHQTRQTLNNTLHTALSLRPEHISAYLMKVEERSIFGKTGVHEAEDDEQAELYLQTSDFLQQNGYEHYEVSNFSLPGRRAIHNSLYWQDKPYIAFGAGAYGFDGTKRYHFEENIDGFIRSPQKIIDEILTPEDKEQERILLAARTSDGIEHLSQKQEHFLQTLTKTGAAQRTPKGYRLTPKGWLVSNAIISNLLEQ